MKKKLRLIVLMDGKIVRVIPNGAVDTDGCITSNTGHPYLNKELLSTVDMAALAQGKIESIPREKWLKIGGNAGGKTVMVESDYQQEHVKIHPADAEYIKIIGGIDREIQRAENSPYYDYGHICQLRIDRARALTTWRAKWPEKAVEHDIRDLKVEAENLKSKAVGALVYDCDGSFDAAYRKKRHDEFMARAKDIEEKITTLEKEKE